MERSSDTPFFVEKTPQQRRSQFHLIQGGLDFEPEASRMSFLAGRVYLESVIMDFFDVVGLAPEDIDEIEPDPTNVKLKFNPYVESAAADEQDEYSEKILRNLSLEKIAAMCEQKLKEAVIDIQSMPLEAEGGVRNAAFLAVRYWRRTRNIIFDSIAAPEQKLELVYSAPDSPKN